MLDRGATENHYDHVHVSFNALRITKSRFWRDDISIKILRKRTLYLQEYSVEITLNHPDDVLALLGPMSAI